MNRISLKVKNFGPITEGCTSNDGFIDFKRVTVLCGPQGSGKSTITKLASSLQWLEKKLFTTFPTLGKVHLSKNEFLVAVHWQGLSSYFKSNTYIEYRGSVFDFCYDAGNVTCSFNVNRASGYIRPQIMYIPAERNIVSILRRSVAMGPLPPPLVSLQIEFEKAEIFFQGKNYKLPSNGYAFEYDKESGDAWIKNVSAIEGESRIRLSEASSGLQAMVPMLLVSDYFDRRVRSYRQRFFGKILGVDVSAEQYFVYQKQIESIFKSALDDKEKMDAIARLLSQNRCFANIVEEPEQNLFPQAQQEVMRWLCKIAKKSENRLIVSTHSPFIVNEMVMSAKVASLYLKMSRNLHGDNQSAKIKELDKLYPLGAAIMQEDIVLYETDDNGLVTKLPSEGGVISDSNIINASLSKWCDSFDDMLIRESQVNGQ